MTTVQVFTTTTAPPGVLVDVRRLLTAAFRAAFSDDDWDHALGGWHVVALEDGGVVSHAAVVPRRIEFGSRPLRAGYVEAVATAPACQGRGLGSLVMGELAGVLRDRFEVGVLSTARHGFYERLGWERWHGPTSVRRADRVVRTPEDDDGIMALRFGPSAELSLDEPIACEARAGDDW